MFYTAEILSLRNRSTLSVLYYVSATGNRSRRINKKEIESIDIVDTIVSIENPSQPYSLRLYSFLLKGIVKIYAIKVRNCQNEACSLMNSMSMTRRPRRKARRERVSEVTLLPESDFISSICSSEVEDANNPNSLIFSSSDVPVRFVDGRLSAKKAVKRWMGRKFDEVAELSEDEMYISRAASKTEKLRIQRFEGKAVFVIDEINRASDMGAISHPVEFDYSEVPTLSSIERIRNSSVASTRSNPGDDAMSSEESWEFPAEGDLNFSEYSGTRRKRAMAFYRVLELGSKGILRPVQNKPYGPIILRHIEI